MKKGLTVTTVLALTGLVGPSLSSAGPAGAMRADGLSATLTPRQVVTPRNKPWRAPASLRRARATFSATISADGRKLRWRISYAKFGHPAFVVGDIHIGRPGRFGAILVRLCADCRSGQSGVRKLRRGDDVQLKASNTWLSLGTDKYPNGVVRGQIKAR